MQRSGQKVQWSGPASAQVDKRCRNNIQLQPPLPTRTNTARCSNHCNLLKGTQIPYKPLIHPKPINVFTVMCPNRRTGNFTRNPLITLAGRVLAKLGEGDFKGAVCLAPFEASIAFPSSETLTALWERHPLPHLN